MLVTVRSFKPLNDPIASNLYMYCGQKKVVHSTAWLLSVVKDAVPDLVHIQSHSQTNNHGHWFGNKTSPHMKLRIDQ